jgi:hypothetical protein
MPSNTIGRVVKCKDCSAQDLPGDIGHSCGVCSSKNVFCVRLKCDDFDKPRNACWEDCGRVHNDDNVEGAMNKAEANAAREAMAYMVGT